MMAAAFLLLIRISGPEEKSTASGVSAGNVPIVVGTAVTAGPVADVVWTYPEGYVDLSELPGVDISGWEFTLVNDMSQENYVRDSFIPQLVDVEDGFMVRVDVDGPLKEFMAACRAEGYTISISRAYMSYYEISYKFNGTASGISDGQGIAYPEAVEMAKKKAHYPGTDEHQLGVAVNFIDGEGNWQITSPAISWMNEHCAEYGFILRYPMGKSAETGWEYTPNQFRYVGKEAAEYIMDKGICLEEFIQAFKDAADQATTE